VAAATLVACQALIGLESEYELDGDGGLGDGALGADEAGTGRDVDGADGGGSDARATDDGGDGPPADARANEGGPTDAGSDGGTACSGPGALTFDVPIVYSDAGVHPYTYGTPSVIDTSSDGGMDGSAALHAVMPAGAHGGSGLLFDLPPPSGVDAAALNVGVACDFDLRFVSIASFGLVLAVHEKFEDSGLERYSSLVEYQAPELVLGSDQGLIQSVTGSFADGKWHHVRYRESLGGVGWQASASVDQGIVETISVAARGTQVRFGLEGTSDNTSAIEVYFDNVDCRICPP